MSEPQLDPLEPELDALLRSERAALPAAAALERVWTRVASGGVSSGGGGGGAGPGGGTSAGWVGSHAVGVAIATFVVGGAAGAGLHAVLQPPPPERIVYVERTAPPTPTIPPVPSSAPAPAIPLVEASTLPAAPVAPGAHASAQAASSSSSSSLAAERALLDDARGALGSGDAARALGLLDDHARRFPRGQLGEEREALAIQALVALGRTDEARARAVRFKAASPNSLFLPAIEGSVGTIQ